jgi:RNA polymerase sigma factor (sigma-70 family)
MDRPLDHLLARLSAGDSAAAGEVFTAFEPYLRRAVRRQLPPPLRAKFDSADVLQSVWTDVILAFREAGCRFVDVDHLRGFLFVATRNRLIDRIRQHERAAKVEERLGDRQPQSLQPRPSELATANDLWEQILNQCPLEHRTILQLRRDGYLLTEIAERTGLHCDSIRRILRTLARQMAFRGSVTARTGGSGS